MSEALKQLNEDIRQYGEPDRIGKKTVFQVYGGTVKVIWVRANDIIRRTLIVDNVEEAIMRFNENTGKPI